MWRKIGDEKTLKKLQLQLMSRFDGGQPPPERSSFGHCLYDMGGRVLELSRLLQHLEHFLASAVAALTFKTRLCCQTSIC